MLTNWPDLDSDDQHFPSTKLCGIPALGSHSSVFVLGQQHTIGIPLSSKDEWSTSFLLGK